MAVRADPRGTLPSETVPVTFGTVRSDCVLLGRRADAPAVEARLDDVARRRLPQAVAEALGPHLAGLGGVIRIDTLSVAFDLTRYAMETGDLARLWAERIVAAFRAELAAGPGANIAIFADHGDYAAAYLERRFGEAGHPDWAFADFAPLRYLTPARAAVEILRSRPEYLPAVARRAERRGDPARLAGRLGATEVRDLLDAWRPGSAVQSAQAEMARIVTAVLSAQAAGDWSSLPRVAVPLAFVLRALAQGEPLSVARLVAAGDIAAAVLGLSTALAGQPVSAATIRAALRGEAGYSLPEDDRARLSLWADGSEGMRALQRMVAAVSGASPAPQETPQAEPAAAPTPEPDLPATADILIASPFAGVVLCLGAFRRLAIPARLGPEATHAVAVALLAPERRALARIDPAIARLFPADAREDPPEWPEVPSEMVSPLSEAQRSAVQNAAGADAWALTVIAHFARSLPGLTGSSAEYMRRQFLHIGGVLHWMPDSIEVTLDPVPLGIVLSMAGATGWQGPLPWLDNRDLVIRIREDGGWA